MGLVSLQEEEERSILSPHGQACAHTHTKPCEHTMRRQPPASQKEGSHQNLTILDLDFFQICEKINVCGLSHSVYYILLWQPKQTKIVPFPKAKYTC